MEAVCHIYDDEAFVFDYLTGRVVALPLHPAWVGVQVIPPTENYQWESTWYTMPFRASSLDEARKRHPECQTFLPC